MDIKKLTHLIPWLMGKWKSSGLLPTPKDSRDFKASDLGWSLFGYTPKYQRKIIEPRRIHNQMPFNTCQWYATTAQKEQDEEVDLSPRSIVCWGKMNGLVSGDGFSDLRSGQKALKDWGILENSDLSDEQKASWSLYSGVDIRKFNDKANVHKAKTFWRVDSRADILKCIDDGRTISTGIDWFTGFNQGGGFSSPWIIKGAVGYKVGGHGIKLIGYDLNYFGYKVYVFQNSYGKDWGDNGKFYITMDYFDTHNYGCYVNLDIEREIVDVVTQYNGQNVKGDGKAGPVFFIFSGKKIGYKSREAFLERFSLAELNSVPKVPQDQLDKIPEGTPLGFMSGNRPVGDYLGDVKVDTDAKKRLIEELNK